MTTPKSSSKPSAADRAEDARQATSMAQARHLISSEKLARAAGMNNAADRYLTNALTHLEGIESPEADALRNQARTGLGVSD